MRRNVLGISAEEKKADISKPPKSQPSNWDGVAEEAALTG